MRELRPPSSSEDEDGNSTDEYEKMLTSTEEYQTYDLAKDIYSAALVTAMHRIKGSNRILVVYPCLLAIFTLCIQLWTVDAMSRYIYRNMVLDLTSAVANELVMFSLVDKTVPIGEYEKICGTFQAYDVHMEVPLPEPEGAFLNSEIVFWAKMPTWSWDLTMLGSDKSLIDQYRFVVDEEFGFPFYRQGYAPLFMLMIFIFTAAILVEFRDISDMFFFLLGTVQQDEEVTAMAMKKDDDLDTHDIMFDPTTQQWYIARLHIRTKVFGAFIVFARLLVGGFIFWEGIQFLLYTSSKADLVLNSLALGFILELDTVIFKSIISKTQQDFLEKLATTKYLPRRGCAPTRFLRLTSSPMVFCICCAVAAYARYTQVEVFSLMYNDAAALCLFAGPTPAEDVFAPVPGFCESLLQVTCGNQTTGISSGNPKGYCVITDFDTTWPKNIRAKSTESIWPDALFPDKTAETLWGWYGHSDATWNHKWLRGNGEGEQHRVFNKFKGTESFNTDILEKICLSMYHSGQRIRNVIVDEDTGAESKAGPFGCSIESGIKEQFFKDVSYAVSYSDLKKRKTEGTFIDIFGKSKSLDKVLATCQKNT